MEYLVSKILLDPYHYEHCIDTSRANCWRYRFHHGIIAQVDVEVGSNWQVPAVEKAAHNGWCVLDHGKVCTDF